MKSIMEVQKINEHELKIKKTNEIFNGNAMKIPHCSLATVGFRASGPVHGNASALRALTSSCTGSRP